MNFIRWIFEKIKKIIKFIFVQTAIFAFRIFLTLFFVIFIGYSIYSKFESERIKEMNKNYEYVEIDMNREFKEGGKGIIDLILGREITYYDFINTLKKIEKDDKVKGVILKLDGYELSAAQSEEIGEILERISLAKKTWSYSTGFDKKSYALALSTKEIIMPDTSTSTSNITGYSVEVPFYKRVADKFGVNFTVIHMGEYKSFGENLVSRSMSQYSKENMETLLNGLYDTYLEKIAKNRGIDKNEISDKILNGNFALAIPSELKEGKLIDSTKYYYNFRKELDDEKIINFEEYRNVLALKDLQNDESQQEDEIALVTLSGDIVEKAEKSKNETITVENAEGLLDTAAKDEKVKGIVIRINSPGGSALSSEIIHNTIETIKEKYKKPIYISMGNVAASGGYYISVAGDKVYANKSTITGSIGVVSIIPNVKDLADKVGVDFDFISKGKNVSLNSLVKNMDAQEKGLVLKSNERVYNEFKDRVSKGRSLTLEEVESVAKGRVWTGVEAKNNKLVDGIASLESVITLMAQDLKLEEGKYGVVEITEEDMKGSIASYLEFLKTSLLSKEVLEILEFTNMEKVKDSKSPHLLYAPYIDKIR